MSETEKEVIEEKGIDIPEEDADIKDAQGADEETESLPKPEDKKTINIASPLEGEGIRGDGQARWYVVHTYSGHENKVKKSIEKMVETRDMHDVILEVIVPEEDRIELKDGQKHVKKRKMFPGYVIVKMVVNNESWYLVRNTQGVTGFVGQGSDPIPLTPEEVARMGIEKTDIDLDVKVGDTVRVVNGPFETMMGEVTEINPDKQVLTVLISAFGRDTPVELEFTQVDKML
jgi:transcriptional antiterminator NusG